MATLKQIYTQLDAIIEELEYIVENGDNDNLSSDIHKLVLDRVESAAIELDGIILDKGNGLYEDDGKDDFLEDSEEEGY
tara:strand:- start:20650 stop:20886 length:237 start_codon:yes stop_codon:yes gene_type:complete